jgi:hypothetical protein
LRIECANIINCNFSEAFVHVAGRDVLGWNGRTRDQPELDLDDFISILGDYLRGNSISSN